MPCAKVVSLAPYDGMQCMLHKKNVSLCSKKKSARLYVSGFHRLNLGACFGGDAIDPACGRFQHVFGSVIRGKGIANRALVGQLSPIAAMDCEQARGKINVSVLGLFTSWPDGEPEAIAALTVRETAGRNFCAHPATPGADRCQRTYCGAF